MSESLFESTLRRLSVRPARPPAELLAALFAAAHAGGLNTREALQMLRRSAGRFDPALARELSDILRRLEASTDRVRTLKQAAEASGSEVLGRLLSMLAWAETTGEDAGERARQIFDELLSRRDAAVTRRAETYPITMIVLMVLFFMPAVLLLLVGPSYVLLLEVLRGGAAGR